MFITAAEVRELSSFSEVKALSDVQIQHYMNRADAWIRRATNRNFMLEDVTQAIQDDLRIATLMLVEYIWYWDNPEVRETVMGPYDGERIGSYSVDYKDLSESEKANPGHETGIKELDNILYSLKHKPSIGGFFRVSGPRDLR